MLKMLLSISPASGGVASAESTTQSPHTALLLLLLLLSADQMIPSLSQFSSRPAAGHRSDPASRGRHL